MDDAEYTDIPLTFAQRQFIFSGAEHPALVGGLGSGKTQAGTMRLIMLMMDDPGANCGYYLPTYDLINLRAMPGVAADLDRLGLAYKLNKSNYSIDIDGYGFIIFRSYDKPERIISFEVAHSIVDELDCLNKNRAAFIWRKVSERNRQKRKKPNTLGLVTTPDQGLAGFVYHRWVKQQKTGYVLYKASTYSNPFLPAGYAGQILANYDPILADLYLNGEFVSLTENKVYHFFNRNRHHATRVITDSDQVVHIGLDFNIGGCCAVAFVIDDNQPVAVDEFVSHDTQDFCNNLTRYKDKKVIIYPDASGKSSRTNSSQSDIAIIAQAGYQVSHNRQNPPVRDRINAYNSLLSHDRIKINTDKCPNLTNALEVQGYNKKGEPEKWDDHPAIDDWLDCSGYMLAYRYPVIRNAVTTSNAW